MASPSPRPASQGVCVVHAEGYAAFFTLPIHNFWLYLLSHAYRLYKNRAYVDLVERLGTRSVYVLSAGWGLIRSDFLTPQYDITFRGSAQRYKRRRQRDVYLDFCQLQDVGDGPVLFFGGKDYLPLFAKLTADLRAERVVFFNSNTPPQVPGCALVRYETTAKTNWHYGCVCAFLDGRLSFSPGSLRRNGEAITHRTP